MILFAQSHWYNEGNLWAFYNAFVSISLQKQLKFFFFLFCFVLNLNSCILYLYLIWKHVHIFIMLEDCFQGGDLYAVLSRAYIIESFWLNFLYACAISVFFFSSGIHLFKATLFIVVLTCNTNKEVEELLFAIKLVIQLLPATSIILLKFIGTSQEKKIRVYLCDSTCQIQNICVFWSVETMPENALYNIVKVWAICNLFTSNYVINKCDAANILRKIYVNILNLC